MKCNYNGCSSKCKGDIDAESCNVLRAYQQGAKKFAKWLEDNSYLNWVGEGNDVNSISAEEVLAEWQKGEL